LVAPRPGLVGLVGNPPLVIEYRALRHPSKQIALASPPKILFHFREKTVNPIQALPFYVLRAGHL
jgi:hypothetical protein